MRMNDLRVHAKIHMHLTTQLREWRQLQKSTYLCYSIYINTNTGKAHLFSEVI